MIGSGVYCVTGFRIWMAPFPLHGTGYGPVALEHTPPSGVLRLSYGERFTRQNLHPHTQKSRKVIPRA